MVGTKQFDASRVYVGTYAKYNGGSILGKWLDLEDYSDCEEFYAACKELHKDEADPELMFQDFENIPSGMISECHVSESVWEWLALDENEREILKAYQDNFYSDGSIDDAQNAYVGEWRSFREFSEEHFDELNEIPDHLAYYIDYDAVARDMGHDYLEAERDDGNVLIFCRNS